MFRIRLKFVMQLNW